MTTRKKTTRTRPSPPVRTQHASLAAEAADWDHGRRTPAGFLDNEAAVPRVGETTAISLRLPNLQLALLKQFAQRAGIGYQVLLKRWLDDRLRLERDRLRRPRAR